MRLAIEVCTTIIWLPLELMVIAALLRGHYRRFPFIFAYTIAEFLVVAAEIPTYWAYYTHGAAAANQRSYLFNLDEVILQVLIYAVVMSLLSKATAMLPSRRTFRAAVIVAAVLFAGISLAIHYSGPHANTGEWLTPWMRDLNFSSAILDLALWGLLISSREKDHLLLLVSGGLGIRFTGEAIGDSLRHLRTHLTQ
jgi:hypothetical protein